MKQLFTFLTIIVLTLALSVGAFATELELSSEAIEVENTEGGITVTDAASTECLEEIRDELHAEEYEEENFFALLYERIEENSEKIIATASLILTALLSFAYKRGLIPIINGALNAMNGAINSIKENSEFEKEKLEKSQEELLSTAKIFEGGLSCLEKKLSELEKKLSSMEKIENAQKATRMILDCQTESLAELFSASTLPEYKKAAIGKRIYDMKEALVDVDKEKV